MSYRAEDYQGYTSRPPKSGLSLLFVVLVGGLLLMLGLLVLLPTIRKEWQANDPTALAEKREAEARVEADAAFRKREAELKAEAEAAGRQLDKSTIAPSAVREVAAKAGPAVVNVTNLVRNQMGIGRRQQLDLEYVPQSEGSGVIVRIDPEKRAYVLTNSHVVRGAERIGITLQSERTINVDMDDVFQDMLTDLAVVRFDAKDLPHLTVAEFADSDHAAVGDWVVAIGSPFGLKQSVTVGIISAKGRLNALRSSEGILNEVELIQTDAAINPGNSGGPLLDLKGRIVGINTAIYTRTGGYQGIGFAIPAKTAQQVFEQLVKPPHKVVRGYMGVGGFVELSARDSARLQVSGGVLIRGVAPENPAARAGMKSGDIIIRYDGKDVSSITQLRKMIMQTRPGTTVPVDVLRLESSGPRQLTLDVTLAEKPPPEAEGP
jgi:serine protease Do